MEHELLIPAAIAYLRRPRPKGMYYSKLNTLGRELTRAIPSCTEHFILSHIILEACKFTIAANLWRFIEWWTSRNCYKGLIAHFQTRSGREQRH